MVSVCFYFHVHQPYRLAKYRIFDIGHHSHYYDEKKNLKILDKIKNKCYLPMNNLIMSQIQKHDFKAAFSFSGIIYNRS